MVRSLHILGICTTLIACGIFALCVDQWRHGDPELERLWDHSGVVEVFGEQQREQSEEDSEPMVSPLVAQAEAFASYLVPTRPTSEGECEAMPKLASPTEPLAPTLPIDPPTATPRFKLCATSVYPNQPHRSMALVAEVGSAEGSERWVKEGSQVGHFVIHEIRQGAVVYRDGDQLREMTVDVAAAPRSLVRDIRPGSRTASAAVEGVGIAIPIPTGPNSVTLSGN